MGIENPGATSTPTPVPPVRGRRAIRIPESSIQSPIDHSGEFWNHNISSNICSQRSNHASPNRSKSISPPVFSSHDHRYGQNRQNLHNSASASSGSESESLYGDPDEPSREPNAVSGGENRPHRPPNYGDVAQQGSLGTLETIGILLTVFVTVALGLYYSSDDSPYEVNSTPQGLFATFEIIEEKYSKQEDDFWRRIRVALQEVGDFNQPKSIIFLYETKTKATMDNILKTVSGVAVCHLTDCLNTPVIIDGRSLNTSEIINDYGTIVSRYREALGSNGVMIIKNLEQVPGTSAQAFHSFCDDYNPIVHKALILFTMRVEKIPRDDPTSFVEKLLSNLWKDIGKDDKFQPLFTRISGTVLPVNPE